MKKFIYGIFLFAEYFFVCPIKSWCNSFRESKVFPCEVFTYKSASEEIFNLSVGMADHLPNLKNISNANFLSYLKFFGSIKTYLLPYLNYSENCIHYHTGTRKISCYALSFNSVYLMTYLCILQQAANIATKKDRFE